jgi:hypothetical protein
MLNAGTRYRSFAPSFRLAKVWYVVPENNQ